jgi:hypothetical protein
LEVLVDVCVELGNTRMLPMYVYQTLKAYRRCVDKAALIIKLDTGKMEGTSHTERTGGCPVPKTNLDIMGW